VGELLGFSKEEELEEELVAMFIRVLVLRAPSTRAARDLITSPAYFSHTEGKTRLGTSLVRKIGWARD